MAANSTVRIYPAHLWAVYVLYVKYGCISRPHALFKKLAKKGLGRYKNFEKILFSFQLRLATVFE